jgi:hypothetical protein
MNLPSATPPDGDFVSYVERLTKANTHANAHTTAHASAHALAGAWEDRLKPQQKASLRPPPAAGTATPSAQPASVAVMGATFITHVKWVVVLWIATQALSAVVPGAGFLVVPALLVYGVWAVFQANRQSSGALVQRLRELARQAAEEAQKNQPSRKK